MSTDPMTAEGLVALRKSLRLTQAEMATEMGMGTRAYQDIEGGVGTIGRRHANNAERVSLRVAVKMGRPEVASTQIRIEATELAALGRQASTEGLGFRVIEIEFGSYGEMIGRRPRSKAYPSRVEAEKEAERLSKRFQRHDYNGEHGYWWGRDDGDGRSYRYVIEGA
jgi:transcriptional regulator with XRE-family HTH domain